MELELSNVETLEIKARSRLLQEKRFEAQVAQESLEHAISKVLKKHGKTEGWVVTALDAEKGILTLEEDSVEEAPIKDSQPEPSV